MLVTRHGAAGNRTVAAKNAIARPMAITALLRITPLYSIMGAASRTLRPQLYGCSGVVYRGKVAEKKALADLWESQNVVNR